MRGLNQPGVPTTPFVPRPGELDYAGAQWGVAVRDVLGGEYAIEVHEPVDVIVAGREPVWFDEPGTGVKFGRVPGLAILRAVPLS